MVRLRLMRLGRRHRPFYRLNAVDQRSRRDGRVIESLGWFNPLAPEGTKSIELKPDRIRHWLSEGAQPSDTVRDMLARHEILNEKEMKAWNADRALRRGRIEAKKAVERAEAAVKEITEFAAKAEGDVAGLVEAAKTAGEQAKAGMSKGDPAAATAGAERAEKALADAKRVDEEAKAKKAAAEAAAKAAEGGEASA